jgi:hypothetical protein
MDIEGSEAFMCRISRALTSASDRPLTFILGSGMSNGSVPDVAQAGLVAAKRANVHFAGGVDDRDPRSRYHESLRALASYVGAPALKGFVQELTLAAYTPANATTAAALAKRSAFNPLMPETCELLERDRSGWNIPRGLAALGILAAQHVERIRGPILTTAFDPLIEIAVRNAGTSAITDLLPSDGGFAGTAARGADDPLRIVHVHGYWNGIRYSLHTAAGMSHHRPQLANSLHALFRDNIVVVLGYQAWQDAFSEALRQVVATGVIDALMWCVLDAPTEPFVAGTMLDLLQYAGEGVQVYQGIDANVVLPLIVDSDRSQPVERAAEVSKTDMSAPSERRAPDRQGVPEKSFGAAAAPFVFLCHSSADKPAVRRLARRLRRDGVRAWLDELEIDPGQDWDHAIRNAVSQAAVVVVCLSHGSVGKSGYVQKEIRYALDVADEQPDGTIFVIPARLEECEVPDRLRRWQWVDLYRRNGYGRLLASLRPAGERRNL